MLGTKNVEIKRYEMTFSWQQEYMNPLLVLKNYIYIYIY